VKCFIHGLGRLDLIHYRAASVALTSVFSSYSTRSVNMTICNEFQCFKLGVEYSKLMATYSCRYLFKGHSYCLRDCIKRRFASQAMCVTSNSWVAYYYFSFPSYFNCICLHCLVCLFSCVDLLCFAIVDVKTVKHAYKNYLNLTI